MIVECIDHETGERVLAHLREPLSMVSGVIDVSALAPEKAETSEIASDKSHSEPR